MPDLTGTELARTRSRIAVAARRGDAQALEDAKREHAAAKIAESIRRVVEAAPPLTPAQRDRLAALLRGGGASGATA